MSERCSKKKIDGDAAERGRPKADRCAPSIQIPEEQLGITRDFAGEKAAWVVSISNPNNPQSVLRVVVFSHLFSLGMDVG
jgi:hypothetical protein